MLPFQKKKKREKEVQVLCHWALYPCWDFLVLGSQASNLLVCWTVLKHSLTNGWSLIQRENFFHCATRWLHLLVVIFPFVLVPKGYHRQSFSYFAFSVDFKWNLSILFVCSLLAFHFLLCSIWLSVTIFFLLPTRTNIKSQNGNGWGFYELSVTTFNIVYNITFYLKLSRLTSVELFMT